MQAIVENSEGFIVNVPATHIQFIEGPEQTEYMIGHLITGEAVVMPVHRNQVDEAKEYGLFTKGFTIDRINSMPLTESDD